MDNGAYVTPTGSEAEVEHKEATPFSPDNTDHVSVQPEEVPYVDTAQSAELPGEIEVIVPVETPVEKEKPMIGSTVTKQVTFPSMVTFHNIQISL